MIKLVTKMMVVFVVILNASSSFAYPEMKNNPEAKKELNVLKSDIQEKAPSTWTVGEIAEVIQVDSYTYLKITQADSDKTLWIATVKNGLSKGTKVRFASTAPLKNFHSKTLKRTFAEIYFVEDLEVGK